MWNSVTGVLAAFAVVLGSIAGAAADERYPAPVQAAAAPSPKSDRPARPAKKPAARPTQDEAAKKKPSDDAAPDKASAPESKSAKGKKPTPGGAAAGAQAEPAPDFKERVGWRLIEDPVTHVRLGLPAKLVPQTRESRTGTRWSSARGEVQIETFRFADSGITLAAVFEQQKKTPAGRKIESNKLAGDSFTLSGLQGLKHFHVRAQHKDGEVRGLTILHDQAMDGIMAPVVAAMWNAFQPFADVTATISAPYRRTVEYGTGIPVSAAGHIVTDRALAEGCSVMVVAGRGPAERVAEDKTTNLALLRLYGDSGVRPLTLDGDAETADSLTIVGIADPQIQGGGGAVTSVASRVSDNASSTISPSPALGFAGAAALDAQGRLVGMVGEKPSVVAGPAAAGSAAALVPAARILEFLAQHNVANSGAPSGLDDAKAGVVRVICVRR
jgi:hypothetical protein